jgi:hypothetical protein
MALTIFERRKKGRTQRVEKATERTRPMKKAG